jgi:hypothetical protein
LAIVSVLLTPSVRVKLKLQPPAKADCQKFQTAKVAAYFVALACSRVRVRTLTANRQSFTMAKTAVAAKIHQALDVLLHFAAKIALDRIVFVDGFADLKHFGVRQLADATFSRDADLFANLLRELRADAVNVLKRNDGALCRWDIDACDAGHDRLRKFVGFLL